MNTLKTIGIVLLSGAIIGSCRNYNNGDKKVTDIVPVKTVKTKRVSVSFPLRTTGILASKAEMKLSFKTGGIIDRIVVDEGQSVRRGQLLAQLNLSEIESMVNQTRLGLDKALRDLQRVENLYNDSVATLEQLQNAQTAVDLARSQLKIAEFNRQYSQIVAPARGKILKKLAEENELIAAGYPLFLFSSSESDWVLRTALSDVEVVKIQPNDSARIYFDAFPDKQFKAMVSEIAKTSDPYTGTYKVELRLIDKNPRFASGFIGKATIIPTLKKEYNVLPISAIHDANDLEGYVYLVKDSVYEKKRVDILHVTDSMVYVNGDLTGNEIVITEGAEYLKPGSIFEIIK